MKTLGLPLASKILKHQLQPNDESREFNADKVFWHDTEKNAAV